ncbi:MAG: glycosyltransferase family 2 protein [Candidatus Woesebacteria bacterium]|nr:MAG: glycosyltransferase family 2 protein [Candidatus Woesebacteria bacterium]
MKKNNLTVVLATRNEEINIGRCLESVKSISDEIIVVDENSTDKTREIAKEYGAEVFLEPHHDIFHITKQKALEKATGDWVLQLDADEEVTPDLAREIKEVIDMSNDDIKKRFDFDIREMYHFKKHQRLIEARDGKIGQETGEVVAFFIPRLNIFLGRPLRYGGVYPDGVIRLVKNGKARFPQKSVHEQIQIDGEVSWLFNDLKHYDSPTMKRYLARFNRYTDLKAREFISKRVPKNALFVILYSLFYPLYTFVNIYFRHKGLLDGSQGFLWAFFSSMHFPVAYYKYITNGNK